MLSYLLITFAFLAVICSVMVISSKNPIHSILYLILVFCNVTFVLILMNAEFIAITFLIVYVGAIAVLFLFVVMMLNIKIIELEENFWKYFPIGLLISSLFFIQICYVFLNINGVLDSSSFLNIKSLLFNDSTIFNNPNEIYSPINLILNNNTEIIGTVTYTYSFYILIIISLILFISMIGSIFLVLNQNINIKRQIIFRQVLRELKNSISLKKK